MSSVISGLKSIWESISSLPSLIANGIVDSLEFVWTLIRELPTKILNGIKVIFIPNTEEIEDMFSTAINTIKSKFGFQDFHFDSIANNSVAPSDVDKNYNINGIGNLRLKFFDSKYLIQGVEYFRPFIRGFIVLCLLFYNYKMFLGFLGHNIGLSNGKGGNEDDS